MSSWCFIFLITISMRCPPWTGGWNVSWCVTPSWVRSVCRGGWCHCRISWALWWCYPGVSGTVGWSDWWVSGGISWSSSIIVCISAVWWISADTEPTSTCKYRLYPLSPYLKHVPEDRDDPTNRDIQSLVVFTVFAIFLSRCHCTACLCQLQNFCTKLIKLCWH